MRLAETFVVAAKLEALQVALSAATPAAIKFTVFRVMRRLSVVSTRPTDATHSTRCSGLSFATCLAEASGQTPRRIATTARAGYRDRRRSNHDPPAMTRPPHDDPFRPDDAEATHFGFDDVPLGEKQDRVDDVFHKVASRYDLMNDLMSGGLHRLWKDRLVAMLNPPKRYAFDHLDVAGGTGDVAFRIARAGGPSTRVTVLDINADMLEVGRERALKRRLGAQVDFIEANAEELPFPDASFDGYTVAFGIRNVPRIDVALAEAYRVLRRGGHFLCLEFSSVDLPLLDRIYDAYSFNVIPRVGQAVTGDGDAYRYLVESIRRFPTAEAFEGRVAAAGFRSTRVVRLTGGIVAIHAGWKL